MNIPLNLITSAIDNALEFSIQMKGNINVVGNIPDYMIDDSNSSGTDGWVYWKPIKADISSTQLSEYENLMKFELPQSYIMFLSYMHFIDLNFGHDVIFFKHTKNWIQDNYEASKWYGIEYTLNKGLVPFAEYSDWGLVCFDSSSKYKNGEYKIIFLDHEDPETVNEFQYAPYDFPCLINDMNNSLEAWKLNKTISD